VSGFGVFVAGGEARLGWRCGSDVLDLAAAGLLAARRLEELFAAGRREWELAVERIAAAVDAGAEPRLPLAGAELALPFAVADFVDFSTSLEHASNLGRLFRPGSEPLLPNWRHLPVGYHGRAGTVVVSGTAIHRPWGQRLDGDEVVFAPTRRLDVEVELGYVVGRGSQPGEPLPPTRFREHVFGIVLVDDWSARDIQAWEYQPLGPFLGKSFATSISAWVTPLALLADCWVEPPAQEPAPLPHLREGRGLALDAALELELNGRLLSRPNARGLYWTGPQLVAHLTSNGTPLRPGDLLATGTISSPEPGSLIELGGPFLADGDEAVIRGRAGTAELGEVRGRVLPASSP
jgi:fumarylacetoacetase